MSNVLVVSDTLTVPWLWVQGLVLLMIVSAFKENLKGWGFFPLPGF